GLDQARGLTELGRQVHSRDGHLQGELRVILDAFHDPEEQAVIGAAAGNHADLAPPHVRRAAEGRSAGRRCDARGYRTPRDPSAGLRRTSAADASGSTPAAYGYRAN